MFRLILVALFIATVISCSDNSPGAGDAGEEGQFDEQNSGGDEDEDKGDESEGESEDEDDGEIGDDDDVDEGEDESSEDDRDEERADSEDESSDESDDGNSDDDGDDESDEDDDDEESADGDDGDDDDESENDNDDTEEESDDETSTESNDEVDDGSCQHTCIAETQCDQQNGAVVSEACDGALQVCCDLGDNTDDTDDTDDTGDTDDTEGEETENDGSINITDFKIEPNPNSNISAFASWKTDVETEGEIQFGKDGYEYKIEGDAAGTEHRILIIGMHAETEYQIKAVATDDSGTVSETGTFTTGSLPAEVPVATMQVNDSERSQSGWTLMNVQVGNGTDSARSDHPVGIVMYDHDGIPVWYYVNGTGADRGGAISTDLLDNNNVLIGPSMTNEPPREVDLAGNIIWEGPLSGDHETEGGLSHDVNKLSNGNYLILRDISQGGQGTMMGDIGGVLFEELDADNNVLWSWNIFDFLTPPSDAAGDWCHGNSATINLEKDEVYISCRFLGLIKTTYQNPQLLWHMPATYNAANMGDITFDPPASQFSDIHEPEIHDDGTILFFDNGGWNGQIGGDMSGYHSRILEFQMDESAKRAELVWEFPGTFNVDSWYKNEFYLPFWGDADRVENGNVLVAAGRRGPGTISRVFEVTKEDGQVVWDLTLPEDHGVYRAQRIPDPPLVEPL